MKASRIECGSDAWFVCPANANEGPIVVARNLASETSLPWQQSYRHSGDTTGHARELAANVLSPAAESGRVKTGDHISRSPSGPVFCSGVDRAKTVANAKTAGGCAECLKREIVFDGAVFDDDCDAVANLQCLVFAHVIQVLLIRDRDVGSDA